MLELLSSKLLHLLKILGTSAGKGYGICESFAYRALPLPSV